MTDRIRHAMIPHLIAELNRDGIAGLPEYEQKLWNNAGNATAFRDHFLEADVALMFSRHGFAVTMQDSPENVQQVSDVFLKPRGYNLTFEPTEDPAEWRGGVTDSGLFWRMNLKKPLDKGGLEISDKRSEGRLAGIKPKDELSMLQTNIKAIQSRWEGGYEGDWWKNLTDKMEANDPQAIQDYKDYQDYSFISK